MHFKRLGSRGFHVLCNQSFNIDLRLRLRIHISENRAMPRPPLLIPAQTSVKKNTKQMRNTKQNCFSHSSVSPRNDKQCSTKLCFANQTNRCLAGFASRSDIFRDDAHG